MMSIVKKGKYVIDAYLGARLSSVLRWVFKLLILFFPIVIIIFMTLVTLAKIHLLGQTHEEFQRFNLSNERSIVIYCEHEWIYEPPGYVYYDVVENGKTLVSKRVFQGVGPQHAPFEKFKMVSADDGDLVAIIFVSNVVIMHDFRTNRSWPGNYERRDNSEDYLLAKDFIMEFKAKGKILHCDAIIRYPKKRLHSTDR
ncbi:hypothetical protein [Gimesia aquarii]|uniref:Uncharacterized protein n=1 Tax=Gimesia aquarii TaxID=2527964 RepID=A0A517WR81_9PLAN|nr:hypothetical protein [Gimesia aquarii]QDU07772.1 hypothetical protein V202x_11330 [Gimesia aquarii]